MPIQLEKLLTMIPSDTEIRVRSAKERLLEMIRDALRKETGLMLSREGVEQVSVPIRLVPGLPAVLKAKSIPDQNWLAALLAPYRATLENLRDSSALACEKLVPILQQHPRGITLLGGRDAHLKPTRDLAEALLRELATFNLIEWILEVEEDVLGAYIYDVGHHLFDSTYKARIELYWGVIGLIALALPTSIEDLAGVVLAHELSHAYTHVGADIEGHRWATHDFASSDRALKEGLAQYYTAITTNRLARSAPTCYEAYGKLLINQPKPYRTHESWLKDFKQEEVRFAMIETRRTGQGRTAGFEAAMKSAKQKLRSPS